MKNILIILIIALLISIFAFVIFANQYTELNISIKKLHAEPNENSKIIFEIPIEVRALAASPDRNWYKVKIKFDLLFFGNYEYIGWVYIPLEKLLEEEPLPAEE